VKEHYPLTGEPRRHRRRDLRRGGAQGSTTFNADGTFRIDLLWGEPHSGSGHDTFVLQDVNMLNVNSVICVGGRTQAYKSVYRRRT
jgi:hypothetical protein